MVVIVGVSEPRSCLRNALHAILLLILTACSAGHAPEATDWPNNGNDAGYSRYSGLDQINLSNAGNLQLAWQWRSLDRLHIAKSPQFTPGAYKVTPIKVGERVYVSTSLGLVVALEAGTGYRIWAFDTRTYADGHPTNFGFNHRGVAYWKDRTAGKNRERIIMATNNGYLWSLDAATGEPDKDFGSGGKIDLTKGLGKPVDRKLYSVVFPPAIYQNTIIVGSSISDSPASSDMPPGHVRGFDAKTGMLRWIFHTIPQSGEPGTETWANAAWEYSGNTNVWSGIGIDPQSGHVYLPVGTPTNDWYGGHRLGNNLYAESLVCLDAATGEKIWHHQLVHHGLWDYDLPAAPLLIDIAHETKIVKAVAQVTKQGFVFVFDRHTGTPLWPIEERSVPASDVPGEKASPTQPVPSRPAPFERQGITHADLIDFSPKLKAAAAAIIEPYRIGPLFTPPSLQGTINLPGWSGGANWGGAAFDPETQIIYIPSVTQPIVAKLKKGNPNSTDFAFERDTGINYLSGPQGLPLTRPPYGRITAIDLKTGEHNWWVPHGDGPRQKIMDLGLPDPGPLGATGTGPLLTRSLLFLAQSDNGRHLLRAFDKHNGRVEAEISLPDIPWGTPMTYMHRGKQYILVAAGQGQSARILALALP